MDDLTNNRIFYYYNTTSSTPAWSYTYKNGGGGNQNVPTAVSSDQAGNFVATGAWGATTDIEELAIIDIANQEVAFAVNSPGSIFWANIAPDATRALGTGKAVHANISGSGNYTYGIAEY